MPCSFPKGKEIAANLTQTLGLQNHKVQPSSPGFVGKVLNFTNPPRNPYQNISGSKFGKKSGYQNKIQEQFKNNGYTYPSHKNKTHKTHPR